MRQSSSSKQNENPAIQALSEKPKIFQVLILLAGTIETLNYGGQIICVMANIIFHNSSMKTADTNIILLIILGEN